MTPALFTRATLLFAPARAPRGWRLGTQMCRAAGPARRRALGRLVGTTNIARRSRRGLATYLERETRIDWASATARTAALVRDLHDECNRAVDKYWSKPNKKGDVFCIFDDASDDETVAAR